MNKTCSVKGCNTQRTKGDLLFCSKCREGWITVCEINGIHEKEVEERIVNKLLKEFQENFLKGD